MKGKVCASQITLLLCTGIGGLALGTFLWMPSTTTAQGPPATESLSIAAAELLAEQRDTNIAGPKIVDAACGALNAFSYTFDVAAGRSPLVSVSVVNRGDCPIGAGGQPVPPGGVRAQVGRFDEYSVDCQQGRGRCRFEVVVTKVSD